MSDLTALVRRADPDRFFTALFAPAERRAALMVLYAFNHEAARAWEVTREPGIALIRLQWWREVLEGARRVHEVAGPLGEVLDAGGLRAADLHAVLDAREETEFADVAAWRDWLARGAGGLAVAAARALGMAEPEDARALGAIYGAAGVLRSVRFAAATGRCLLPADVLAAHGLTAEDVVREPGLAPVAALAGMVEVPARRRWVRGEIAAVLPAVLGRRDLSGSPSPRPSPSRGEGGRSLADKLAVVAAYAASRA